MPRPTPPRLLLLLALGLAVVSSACSPDASEPGAGASATAPPAPLAELQVERADLCAAVGEDLVTAGLPAGSTSVQLVSWGNGDPVGGDGDVAHEVGCTWRTGEEAQDPATQVWVFVPPVDAAAAKRLRSTAAPARCRSTGQARSAGFGAQPASWTCARGSDRDEVRWAARFGDAWLTCAVRGPGASDRVREFCTGVVRAAATDQPGGRSD